jgi:hypothetical protein
VKKFGVVVVEIWQRVFEISTPSINVNTLYISYFFFFLLLPNELASAIYVDIRGHSFAFCFIYVILLFWFGLARQRPTLVALSFFFLFFSLSTFYSYSATPLYYYINHKTYYDLCLWSCLPQCVLQDRG